MLLSRVKEIEKMKLIDSSTRELCTYQLTRWEKPEEIHFAIEQLNYYDAPWQLRQQDSFGLCAVFVKEPEYLK